MVSVLNYGNERVCSDYVNEGLAIPIPAYLFNLAFFVRQVTYRIPIRKFLRWNSISCSKCLCQGGSVQA